MVPDGHLPQPPVNAAATFSARGFKHFLFLWCVLMPPELGKMTCNKKTKTMHLEMAIHDGNLGKICVVRVRQRKCRWRYSGNTDFQLTLECTISTWVKQTSNQPVWLKFLFVRNYLSFIPILFKNWCLGMDRALFFFFFLFFLRSETCEWDSFLPTRLLNQLSLYLTGRNFLITDCPRHCELWG